jgi:hypothetical protein
MLVSMCGNYEANKDCYPRCVFSQDRVRGTERVAVLDDSATTERDRGPVKSYSHYLRL